MKVKLEITTDHENIEMANFLLKQGYNSAIKNLEWQKHFGMSENKLKKAETFRKALLKSFTNQDEVILTKS